MGGVVVKCKRDGSEWAFSISKINWKGSLSPQLVFFRAVHAAEQKAASPHAPPVLPAPPGTRRELPRALPQAPGWGLCPG